MLLMMFKMSKTLSVTSVSLWNWLLGVLGFGFGAGLKFLSLALNTKSW